MLQSVGLIPAFKGRQDPLLARVGVSLLTSGQVNGEREECVSSDSKTAGQGSKANLAVDPYSHLLMPLRVARQSSPQPRGQ